MDGTAATHSDLAEAPNGTDAAATASLQPAELEELRRHVRQTTAAISDLLEGRPHPLDDEKAAHELAAALKPYVDRLYTLRRLLEPLERIRDNREQIRELQAEIAEDVAAVEDASSSDELPVDDELAAELRSEIAAVKRDRKIFVPDDEPEPEPESAGADPEARVPLAQRPLPERLRVIFGPRLVDLSRLGELLEAPFAESELAAATASLESVWQSLFDTPALRPHVEANRVAALRRAFADFALVYRPTQLPAPNGQDDRDEARVPCTLETLRDHFGGRFMAGGAAWYSRLSFYDEPFASGHWALVDRQYLNVTFKRPKIRLMLYARANELSTELVRQKSALEEAFDRCVVDAALERQFFTNCNALTRTAYQQAQQKSKKQVYIYYKDEVIRISGKRGTPHWRPGRPRWPGVMPSVVFEPGG